MTKSKADEAKVEEAKKDEDAKINEEAANVTNAALARESHLRDEKVVQRTNSDVPTSVSPAEGPVPRNADPFAHQRAAGAGDFKPVEDEAASEEASK